MGGRRAELAAVAAAAVADLDLEGGAKVTVVDELPDAALGHLVLVEWQGTVETSKAWEHTFVVTVVIDTPAIAGQHYPARDLIVGALLEAFHAYDPPGVGAGRTTTEPTTRTVGATERKAVAVRLTVTEAH